MLWRKSRKDGRSDWLVFLSSLNLNQTRVLTFQRVPHQKKKKTWQKSSRQNSASDEELLRKISQWSRTVKDRIRAGKGTWVTQSFCELALNWPKFGGHIRNNPLKSLQHTTCDLAHISGKFHRLGVQVCVPFIQVEFGSSIPWPRRLRIWLGSFQSDSSVF